MAGSLARVAILLLLHPMNVYRKEIGRTLTLAFPIMIGQLSSMAMGMVDAAMVGRGVGTQSLAALTFAMSYTHIPFISLFGLISATSITLAQAFGAGQRDHFMDVLRHGLILAGLAGLVVVALMNGLYGQLDKVNYLGQPPELIPIARPYVLLYTLSFVVYLLQACLRCFCEAQNRPWTPLLVMMSGILFNVFLNWIFIFGNLGVPAMGLTGAGIATLIANIYIFLMLGFVLTRIRRFNFDLAGLLQWRLRWDLIKQILGLGLPSMLQIAVEVGAFAIAAFMMGFLGSAALAAHHVAIQIAAFSFMVPMGMSFAVAIRVGQAAGANDYYRVKVIGLGALSFIAIWMLAAGGAILGFRTQLPSFFSLDPVVVGLASSFLVITALFQLFDGLQVTALGALRGLRDVRLPSIAVLFNYWLVALPLAYYIGIVRGMEGIGIWSALLFGLLLSAIMLTARFWYITRQFAAPVQKTATP